MDGITSPYIWMVPIYDLTPIPPQPSEWVDDETIILGDDIQRFVFHDIPGVDPSYRPECPGEANERYKYTFDSMNGLTPIFGD